MLEITYGCSILLTHVLGSWMISQGADGISQGEMHKGEEAGGIIFLVRVGKHLRGRV